MIRDLHGVESAHLRSETVHETFRGETAWEGDVQIFAITGHLKAQLAYAWSHETDEGGRRYVPVLGVPPVNSALDAVRAAIAAESKGAPRFLTATPRRLPLRDWGGVKSSYRHERTA